MSGGLAPSKSTIYVSNLPFSLTNNDLHKIFNKYGKVVKVTIMKDSNRKSKGVAFVLFLERESAHKAVKALNKVEMFGRTLSCNIAKDNGRTPEFIRRKIYKDKSHCYECGEEGHLSYKCPNNLLGDREQPAKKKRKKSDDESDKKSLDGDEEDESLSAAINYQYQMMEQAKTMLDGSMNITTSENTQTSKKKYKKDSYFSDEEELDDG
ncbi:zinc finger CCHC-type and RNA-binding motif-containing protein 1 isoform X1 [Octopus sinensis]|uniref:Zinc finger CCHC-type and RNA-binding motif-containing protein 1 n=1 Tax=Octopus sinensis TaxID=2607531 RepID=A0A6P7SYS5_9MOLL|nr:zinc finger CCHC-type and RNA-binding motif-containing protein 1 isoform X1 [Octopus sinensis]